jgi:translation initiation factor 2B subunit (eIF-2B alpha/beta/delta family)
MASPATNFFNKYYGKQVKFWASTVKNSFECTDLAAVYNEEVIGGGRVSDGLGAKQWWDNYPRNSYTRIPNTASFMPKRGDLVVWGAGLGNGYGHIGIATGENTNLNVFNSFDQNWGGQYAHSVTHSYLQGFLGVLRPNKDVNFDAEKAAIDAANKAARDAAAARVAEAARIAADAAQKAEAKRVAEEQAKLVIEQERLAKEAADKIAADKLEAERIAKEILDGEIAKQAEEANKEKEKGEIMSPKFKINKADLISLGKGFLITLAGAAITFIAEYLTKVNFGQYTVVAVPLFALLVNTARKWLVDNSK